MTDLYWKRRVEAITNEPAVPILVARMHRVFWVPRRYKTVAAVAFDGRAFTVRAMAARAGYSVKGAWSALRALAAMGIGVLTTTRGWMGRTRFRVSDDASVCANVSTTVTHKTQSFLDRSSSYVSRRTVVETLPQTVYVR